MVIESLAPADDAESAKYIRLDLKRDIKFLGEERSASYSANSRELDYLNNIIRSKYRACC